MLPIEKKGDALAVRQKQRVDYNLALLNRNEVKEKLSSVELMIANAGTILPISLMRDDELIAKVSTATKYICRDVGIKDWNNSEIMKYDATRFYTTLKAYYKDLTLKEIKIAFELAAVGELDEWLPKDRNGNPDNKHYQSFSLEYYTKILKAYRNKKNKVWHKANKALPIPEVIITDEQKKSNRIHFLNDIYDAFYKYKNDKIEPNFIIKLFIDEFVKQGVIKELPKPSAKSKDRAYRKLMLSRIPRHEKKGLRKAFHNDITNNLLLTHADNIQYNRCMTFIFICLIRKNIDIKTVIK